MAYEEKLLNEDPWQCKTKEDARYYAGVCDVKIDLDDDKTYESRGAPCHACAYPGSYYVNKWAPVAITTDLRKSKKFADWYEFLLDEKISPYRNSTLIGHERIVGYDGYLRAVKVTNMQCKSRTMLNFLVMTRMPFEFPYLVELWRKFVKAGIHPCAAMMVAHLFTDKRGGENKLQRNVFQPVHQAMNFAQTGEWQPSVKRLMEADPDDDSKPYRTGTSQNTRGFSDIWGKVRHEDRVQKVASAQNKVVVAKYTGKFGKAYNRFGGQKVFGLEDADPFNPKPDYYKFEDIVSSAAKWSAL